MPSLSFDSQGGRPIGYINVTKEELKQKPDLKPFNNQIIYLHDHNDGVKEIDLKDVNIFPLLKSKEGETQNHRIAIFGRSGSGKSHIIGQMLDMMKSKKHGNPERDIVILSGVDEDEPLDRVRGKKGEKSPPERIDLNDPSFMELRPDDFEDCIVIFDDVEHLSDKAINKAVLNLRNSMLEKSRHFNTDIFTISHNALGGSVTKFVNSEASGFFVFPAFSQHHQLTSYLHKYAGLSKEAIQKLINIGETKSRWIFVSNMAPCYVVYSKGCYLVK